MAKRTLLNETTEVSPERTAGEISSLLVECGARQITVDYDMGEAVGMRFSLLVNGQVFHFKMPVRTAGVARIFEERRKKSMGSRAWEFKEKDAAQAERVAWRQLLRWTAAQLAMVESGAAEAREVFLPYLFDGKQTFFEHIEATKFQALPSPQGRHV